MRSYSGSTEVLKNRPYFGGIKSSQIKSISELNNWGENNLLICNIFVGISGLFRATSCPFQEKERWHIFAEEIGTWGRTTGDIKIRLDKFSVVCYPNGTWEKDWFLLKTTAYSLKSLRRSGELNKILKYRLVYYP